MRRRSPLPRTRVRSAFGVLTVAALVGAGLAVAAPARAATVPPQITRLSGETGTVAGAQSFATWRGAPNKAVNVFMPKTSWAQMENPTYGGPDDWKGQNVQLVWSVTMFPSDGEGANLKSGAAGDYNKYFLGMAKKLVADGEAHSDIRLGWEMNGSWFSWTGDKDPTDWIAYWRQVVTTMRSVSGQAFTFDWSPADTVYNFDASTLYPGDAYVDEVGMSIYDQAWNYPSSDSTDRWNYLDKGGYKTQGLEWLASFAQQHSKPMEFVEWGLADRTDGHGGNDDPYFIQQFHTFLTSHWVRLETLFNDNETGSVHNIAGGDFPRAAAMYKQLWDADQVSATAPIIDVSFASNRFAPVALSREAVSAPGMYAFVSNAPSGTTSVRFYMDRSTSSTPTHVENYWPWDLNGGANSNATSYNSGALSTGTHVLTAVLSGSYGSQTISSTFTAT